MTLGGLAVVLAFMAAVLLLALVVVVSASWSHLEHRRGDGDRTGRALAAGMSRVEEAGARGRELVVRADRGARPLLARWLDGGARGAQALAARLAGRRGDDRVDRDDDHEQHRDRGHDQAREVADEGTRPRVGAGGPHGPGAPAAGADAAAEGDQGRASRLPASFRDRLAG